MSRQARTLVNVTDSDRQDYQRDGVVCLRSVFPSEWIETLRRGIEKDMLEPGPLAEEYTPKDAPGRYFGDLDMWQRITEFRDFVFRSPAAEIAAEVMDSNKINFFYDQLFVKEPQTRERTPWHQDQPYWAVSGRQVCTMWIPLDPVSRDAAVEYVAGSHNWGAHNPRHFLDNSPYEGTGLPELPDIEEKRDELRILSWDTEPGDCIVFQAMVVHGAPGNRAATRRRRAVATRWTGDDARYCLREGEIAIPTSDPGLSHGDPLDSELFPVVFRRRQSN